MSSFAIAAGSGLYVCYFHTKGSIPGEYCESGVLAGVRLVGAALDDAGLTPKVGRCCQKPRGVWLNPCPRSFRLGWSLLL